MSISILVIQQIKIIHKFHIYLILRLKYELLLVDGTNIIILTRV